MSSFTLKRLLVYSVGKMRLICSILTKKEKKKRKLRVAGTGIQKQCVKNGEECLHEQKVHSEWADVVCFFWFSFLCPISHVMACISRLFSSACVSPDGVCLRIRGGKIFACIEIYLLYRINRGLVEYIGFR